MSPHRITRILLTLAAACAALLLVPAAGMAHGGDRNHDRIPDRWERAHKLSLKVNQANKDQDDDGLRNKAEFLAGTNPRDDDSDDDGTEDGQEKAGQVVSFTNGVLIVHLFATGDDIKGIVDDRTNLHCDHREGDHGDARTASDGEGHGDDDRGHEGDEGERQNGRHGNPRCATSELTPGRVVGEAKLEATAKGLAFRKIELIG
jgi:hypothetical protein